MKKHNIFLKWWLIVNLITIATLICVYFGVFKEVFEGDKSYISFVIMAVFYGMTIWCGKKCWMLTRKTRYTDDHKLILDKDNKKELERISEYGWFASDVCLSLGMTGTVLGFIMMLASFQTIDINQTNTIQSFIKNLGTGMSIALYTTLTGLISGILLKVQYFILYQALKDTIK